MAKYRPKSKGHESGREITTKSWFGSHADMVVGLEELQSRGLDKENTVFARYRDIEDYETVCKDDRGYYITLKARLDNGMADPNRYSSEKRIVKD